MANAVAQASGRTSEATSTRVRWIVGSLIISALAVVAALYLTRSGAGASGDSVHFLMGAENILEGNGYSRTAGDGTTRPITHFPPLYSILIAAIGVFGAEAASSARWINALLFGVNLWLASYLVFRGTRSATPALLTPIALAAAAPLVSLHGWIMTEPVYIFFALAALIGLHHYVEDGKIQGLLFAAAATALAILARYVGLSLVMTGGLAILILGSAEGRKKLGHAALFGAISVAPIGLWFMRNIAISGGAANREIAFHPIRRELVKQYIAAAVEWIFARAVIPYQPRVLAAAVIAGAAPAALIFHDLFSKDKEKLMGRLEWLLILYLPCYFATLAINSYWLDAATTAGAPIRYLAPALVAMIMLAVVTYWKWWVASAPRSPLRLAIPLVGMLLLGLHVLETVQLFTGEGLDRGYVTIADNNPDLVDMLADLDSSRVLISNNPELVYVISGRPAFIMPIEFDVLTLQAREDFDHQVAATRRRLERGGRLIVFGGLDPVDQRTLARLGAVRFDTFEGAAIYGYLD